MKVWGFFLLHFRDQGFSESELGGSFLTHKYVFGQNSLAEFFYNFYFNALINLQFNSKNISTLAYKLRLK